MVRLPALRCSIYCFTELAASKAFGTNTSLLVNLCLEGIIVSWGSLLAATELNDIKFWLQSHGLIEMITGSFHIKLIKLTSSQPKMGHPCIIGRGVFLMDCTNLCREWFKRSRFKAAFGSLYLSPSRYGTAHISKVIRLIIDASAGSSVGRATAARSTLQFLR